MKEQFHDVEAPSSPVHSEVHTFPLESFTVALVVWQCHGRNLLEASRRAWVPPRNSPRYEIHAIYDFWGRPGAMAPSGSRGGCMARPIIREIATPLLVLTLFVSRPGSAQEQRGPSTAE